MSRGRAHPPTQWFPHPLLEVGLEIYVFLAEKAVDTIVWHWCPKNERWEGASIGRHTIVEREPLTIDPSLHRPDCCGWHGWIKQGKWIPA